MTEAAAHELLTRVLLSPQTSREEHRLSLLVDGVVQTVHISTVCGRASGSGSLSGKRLSHYQAERLGPRASFRRRRRRGL